jgi:hypothetical protein
MKYGNRASLEAIQRKTIEVEVPEADAVFRLREMSGTDRDKFEVSAFKEDQDGKRSVNPLYLRARLVALCLVGEDNVRLYADDEIHMLSDNAAASVIGKLFAAAQALNALDGTAVEDAAKNSESAPAGASPSDLH